MGPKRLVTAAGLAVLVVIVVAVGSNALAANHGKTKVFCHLRKVGGRQVVSCPASKLRGPRGRRGPQGVPGAPGPAGGAGSNLNLNFNAYLTASKTKEITVGNFTITAAAQASGNCEPVRIRAGGSDSQLAIGAGGNFAFLANNTNRELTNGQNSNMFTAVSENGASTMSGIVGATSAGGICLVSGYVTGV